jgi:hypothetical protein
MGRVTFPASSFSILSSALALIMVTAPALGHQVEQRSNERGAVASSGSATTTGANGYQGATVVSRSGQGNTGASEDCRVVERGSPNAAAAGADSLSSTTRVPGGTSVTVQSGTAAAGSTAVTAGSSSSADVSSTTQVPGGSSVTVQAGDGVSSSSVGTSSGSGGGHQSSVVVGAGQGEECVITVNPGSTGSTIEQQPKR